MGSARHLAVAFALVTAGCGVDPIRDAPTGCSEVREGCVCDAPDPVACAETGGARQQVGECAPGLRSCVDGLWGPCEGELRPSAETCDDGLDNDCDGAADEGARCDCSDGCTESNARCFEDAVIVGLVPGAAECDLTLATREEALADAWIANTMDATVSRVDTVRGVETARYASIDATDHGAPPITAELECSYTRPPSGNCPSRTAVAPNGDAFVANRAFGAQGTVTKIAGHLDRCRDRDGDGVIQTSQDLDGDGAISTFLEDGEYLGTADECIVWTVPVGEIGEVPRALAIAPAAEPGATGHVWVGLFDGMRAVAIDPETGATVTSMDLDLHPYGAVASADGRVWFTETEWGTLAGLQSIDAASGVPDPLLTPPPIGVDCVGSYGIALDEMGRVWRGTAPCVGVTRYDPATDTWTNFAPEGSGVSAGVATDGAGHVWTVFHEGPEHSAMSRVARLSTADGTIDRQYDLGVVEPWGVGLDGEGDAWVVAKGSDRAVEIDLETAETRTVVVGDKPYTYSDFTGYQLYQITDPLGTVDLVFEGCPVTVDDPTQWFDVRTVADVPAGAAVTVTLRNADDRDALAGAPWLGPFGLTADARDLDDRLLGVHIELQAGPDGAAPVLHDVQVAFSCPDFAN